MSQKRDAATAKVPELDDESEHTSTRMARAAARHSDPPDSLDHFEASSASSVTPPPDLQESMEASETGTPEVDATSDSMLSRYFRDMATHQVMGPDEELQAAQSVEEAEVDHWASLLSYLPTAEFVLNQLEQDISGMNEEERPQVLSLPELRKMLKTYKKQPRSCSPISRAAGRTCATRSRAKCGCRIRTGSGWRTRTASCAK